MLYDVILNVFIQNQFFSVNVVIMCQRNKNSYISGVFFYLMNNINSIEHDEKNISKIADKLHSMFNAIVLCHHKSVFLHYSNNFV